MKLSGLKHNIEALCVLSFMDLKLKYQSSFLGFFWSFLKPLLQFSVYYIIFGKLLKVGSGSQYALQLFFGVIMWSWFAEATSLGLHSFIGKRTIITKVKTNRLLPPLAAFLTPTINYVLNFFIFFAVFLFFTTNHVSFNFSGLMVFIYSLLCVCILTVSINLILANLNVFFRDVQPIWELVLTYGVFITPVIYQIPIPKKYEILYYSLNLLAFPLQNMKSVFFSQQQNLLTNYTITGLYNIALLLLLGLAFFTHQKLSKYVADYL